MTIDQAYRAAMAIRPKVLIPYHFSKTPVEELKQRLDRASSGIDVHIRHME